VRISVSLIVNLVAKGMTAEEIVSEPLACVRCRYRGDQPSKTAASQVLFRFR
jgi:hypothetical protein